MGGNHQLIYVTFCSSSSNVHALEGGDNGGDGTIMIIVGGVGQIIVGGDDLIIVGGFGQKFLEVLY